MFLRECTHFAVEVKEGARRLKVERSSFTIEWRSLGMEEGPERKGQKMERKPGAGGQTGD